MGYVSGQARDSGDVPFAPGGGGGGVDTVNGIAPVGGNVSLDAGDIPFTDTLAATGSSDLQGALTYAATHVGRIRELRTVADLPAPVGGKYTIPYDQVWLQPGFGLPPGGYLEHAPPSGRASVIGSDTISSVLFGDRAGPLYTLAPGVTQCELGRFSIFNASLDPAARAFEIVGSLIGGVTPFLILVLKSVTCRGAGIGSLVNIASGRGSDFLCASWLDGVTIDGINGGLSFEGASVIDSQGGAVVATYRAFRTLATTVIGQQLLIGAWNFDGLDNGSHGVLIDLATTIAAPSGVRLIDLTGRSSGSSNAEVVDPAGITPNDPRVFLRGGTPDFDTTAYGGADFSDLVDYIEVPIVSATVPVRIPSQSIAATPLAPLPGAEGIDLEIDSPTIWRLRNVAGERQRVRLTGFVTATDAGGADFTTELYATFQNPAGVETEIINSRIRLDLSATPITQTGQTEPFTLEPQGVVRFYGVNPASTQNPRLFAFSPKIEVLP